MSSTPEEIRHLMQDSRTAPLVVEWTPALHGTCDNCQRRFRVGVDTLAAQRTNVSDFDGQTDEQIAASLNFCLECVDGQGAVGEHVVPELRKVGTHWWEVRANTDQPWVYVEGQPEDDWGDGNALEAVAKQFSVPVDLIINRVEDYDFHPSERCPCDECEADRQTIIVIPAVRGTLNDRVFMILPNATARVLADALEVALDGGPDAYIAALTPFYAALRRWERVV